MAEEVLGLHSLILLLAFQDYVYDINGNRIPAAAGPPVEINERVLEDAGGRKVTERVIRDPATGAVEKIRIEEVKHAGGRVVTNRDTYRGDLNGNLVLAEKASTDFRKTGDQIHSVTTVSKGSINGDLDVVERAETTGRETDKLSQTDTRIFRKDGNGAFRVAARQVAERLNDNGQTKENVTEYQAATQDGSLELSSQRVTTETKGKDGGVTKQVEIYGMAQPGRASERGELKLREQQIVEQRPGAGKSVQETFSIRRPDPNGQLPRDFTKISDRTCQTKCQ